MSLLNFGISAVTKLAVAAVLAAAFLFGLVGVVYMSLQGSEVKVPEITGKNFSDSERELASLGLKIKRRAERPSADAPNTVLEQLPKPGETVKTGQLILVVTSQPSAQPDETPSTLKKSIDTEKIEEMISDKPKKKTTNSNTNSAKKKADTTRDVVSNSASDTDASTAADSNSNKKESGNENKVDKGEKGDKGDKGKESAPSPNRQTPTPVGKPTPSKPSGDRLRTVPRP